MCDCSQRTKRNKFLNQPSWGPNHAAPKHSQPMNVPQPRLIRNNTVHLSHQEGQVRDHVLFSMSRKWVLHVLLPGISSSFPSRPGFPACTRYPWLGREEKGEGAGGEGKAGRRKGAFKRPWGGSLGTQRAQLLLRWRLRLAAQLIGRLEEAAREEPAPGTHRGSGKQEEGWWWRAGKDGTEERQRHTRGRQGKRPEQERTSQPLCARQARFLTLRRHPKLPLLSLSWKKTHLPTEAGTEGGWPLLPIRAPHARALPGHVWPLLPRSWAASWTFYSSAGES